MAVLWRTELGSPRVRRVEGRRTPAHIFVAAGSGWRKEALETRYHKYHETFDAAKRYLIGENTTQLKRVRAALESLERFEKKVLALAPEDCLYGGDEDRVSADDETDDADTLQA